MNRKVGMRSLLRIGALAAAFAAVLAWTAIAGEKPKLPAFPGTEGFGAVATGGRGGKVLKVTNLNSKGPGSLQWACGQKGPRIIVFTVSGFITPPCKSKGKNWLSVKDNNITIAGQTAPGAGISLDGMFSTYRGMGNGRKKEEVSDIIVRFLRIRPRSSGGGRGANLRGMELTRSKRIILDHCSVSWSTDDCVAYGSSDESSLQWCSVEESDIHLEGGDEPHNFAIISGDGSKSIHHNLVAHHHDRAPYAQGHPIDFRNNTLYNVFSGIIYIFGKEDTISAVGNYGKPGPGGLIGNRIQMSPTTMAWPTLMPNRKRGRMHFAGNYHEDLGGYAQRWKPNDRTVTKLFANYAPVRTHTAEEAYELALAHAGCLPRDSVSARTIAEVKTGTGYWGVNGAEGGPMEGLTPGKAPADGDDDGMPDEWEKAHKLDPNTADNNKIVPAGASLGDRHKGYTYIEYYINELADLKIAAALTQARLDQSKPKPWDKPANKLNSGSMPHKTLDEMVKAIREQTEAMRGNTNPAWYAVQQLLNMGEKGKPAVPELIKILEASKTIRTASFAAWALGAIGPSAKEAVPALTAALGKKFESPAKKFKPFRTQGFIAWALGRIGPDAKAAVPALAKKLSSRRPRNKQAAAWALSQMGPDAKGAMSALIAALGSDSTTRAHAVKALVNIGEPAISGLTGALGGRRGASGAVKALGLIGPKARGAVPGLIKLLGNPDRMVRSRAALALARIDPAAAGAALAGALADKEVSVRHSVARALGEAGPAASGAVSALVKALGDERKEVKRAAALALGGIGKAAVPALVMALSGGDPFVRKYAARALGNVGADARGGVDALVKALGGKDAEVRREAVWSLALIGPAAKGAADALTKAQKDDSDYVVRFAAAEALKRANQ